VNAALRIFEPDKWCKGCDRVLPSAAFWRSLTRRDGLAHRCIECQKVTRDAYAAANPERIREIKRRSQRKHREVTAARERARNARVRLEVLRHYCGGEDPSCACCGEAEVKFLVIDHINGSGNKHRREQKAYNLADWCKRNGFPEGFRILCQNCNAARSLYGECPHVQESADREADSDAGGCDSRTLDDASFDAGRSSSVEAGAHA